MLIDANTRISDLIKQDKNSIDAIASIARPLEKLKNPLLRKIMASRVTLAEAAKMGGCQLEDFARVLRPLGFEFSTAKLVDALPEETRPFWLTTLDPKTVEKSDVREMLASGEDPLKQITQRFKKVKAGHSLCIINSFIPTPLVKLLEKDGVKSYTETIQATEFHTYFFKPNAQQMPKTTAPKSDRVHMDTPRGFAERLARFPREKTKEIDVRHLEMPMPMQSLLQELALLPKDSALYVHHKRIPIYLLEELADQDFDLHVLNLGENDVKLFIFHTQEP